jgi:hypothetical protein
MVSMVATASAAAEPGPGGFLTSLAVSLAVAVAAALIVLLLHDGRQVHRGDGRRRDEVEKMPEGEERTGEDK